jgi:hypothetical protein
MGARKRPEARWAEAEEAEAGGEGRHVRERVVQAVLWIRIRIRIRIRSDPELFAGSGSGIGSGINHFGSGSGQSGSGMNFIPNLSVKKLHFLNQMHN